MTRRNVPFGYVLHDGRFVIDTEEAGAIREIFELYIGGCSYAQIASRMETGSVPYDERDSQWNKHKVKRILENQRYLGTETLPEIISAETFEKAKKIHETKKTVPVKTDRTAKDMIWRYIRCDNCGGWSVRCGGANKDRDRDVLVCKQCHASVQIRKSEIENAVLAQFNAHEYPQTPSYQISEEVMRLNHQINRGLENPDNPAEVIDFILEGITARCGCCADVGIRPKNHLTEVKPEHFGQVVSGIRLSMDVTVTVEFK